MAKGRGRIAAKDINGNRQVALPVSKAPLASLATDGVYVVRGINYKGDTRGQEWYMDMTCFARGASEDINDSNLKRTGV